LEDGAKENLALRNLNEAVMETFFSLKWTFRLGWVQSYQPNRTQENYKYKREERTKVIIHLALNFQMGPDSLKGGDRKSIQTPLRLPLNHSFTAPQTLLRSGVV
jgi:hypothetical protein